ncbi:uncharacterized protein LOC128964600 [Oppia nitens]|uniref:uncharacterized protein LOC128964600 n=1 Tax=Oppia nitens TaxID=1686743 RepID=UPI0023D9EE87|nr:uncharacterized protein LOC128964600 [Oppia nitens]
MKILYLFEFIVLISGIKAYRPIPVNYVMPETKTIYINHFNIPSREPQTNSEMQSMTNDMQNSNKQEDNNNNNAEVKDVVINESEEQYQTTQTPNELPKVYQRVYKLPAMTRMIADTIVNEDDNQSKHYIQTKKSPQWRSPTPFNHDNCPHNMHKNKKLRSNKRRVQKHFKQMPTTMTTTMTTTKAPVIQTDELRSESPLLLTLLSDIESPPESETPNKQLIDFLNKVQPIDIMSIIRKTQSKVATFPLFPNQKPNIWKMPLFMSILDKLLIREPESPYFQQSNPFPNILDKSEQNMYEKRNFLDNENIIEKTDKKYNFNFNFNVTVNNNYQNSDTISSKLLPQLSRSLLSF